MGATCSELHIKVLVRNLGDCRLNEASAGC